MMSGMKRILATASAMFLAVGALQAADLDAPLYGVKAPEMVPVEIGNSWYLRGDISYNFEGRMNNIGTGSIVPGFDNDYQDGIAVGGGVGYQFNNYLRFDATVDRIFSSEYSESTQVASTGLCLGTAAVTQPDGSITYEARNLPCVSEDSVSYNAITVMANAYVDLGTYMGFTPYVGGGVGMGRVRWSEETGRLYCYPGVVAGEERFCNYTGAEANTNLEQPGTVSEGSDFRLAYSVMAGVGYKMSKNMTLDLGYKYTKVGDGSEIVYSTTTGSSLAQNGFDIHQVRAGLRYSLW